MFSAGLPWVRSASLLPSPSLQFDASHFLSHLFADGPPSLFGLRVISLCLILVPSTLCPRASSSSPSVCVPFILFYFFVVPYRPSRPILCSLTFVTLLAKCCLWQITRCQRKTNKKKTHRGAVGKRCQTPPDLLGRKRELSNQIVTL